MPPRRNPEYSWEASTTLEILPAHLAAQLYEAPVLTTVCGMTIQVKDRSPKPEERPRCPACLACARAIMRAMEAEL